ncbi:ion channel DMI1 [Marinobacteraceae bacterium S3BR75-40.1]
MKRFIVWRWPAMRKFLFLVLLSVMVRAGLVKREYHPFMLPFRFVDRLKFFVERQFVKGALFQLLVVVAVIGLISLLGGLMVRPAEGQFDGLGEAVWWAFLRLTDPGYLGDDQGTWRRVISTVLTISGYVVFLGALVAIMTRWLIDRMNQLERGLTPVAIRNHVVVLGWTNRTLPIVSELLGSVGRMRRFLRAYDAHRLRLVVLAEGVSAARLQELHQEPGIGRKARNVILREGSPLQDEALYRAACHTAAAILIPSNSHGYGSLVTSDIEIIKALLSLQAQARRHQRPLPYVVAEIEDSRKLAVFERAYPGPLEVIAGDATVSRLMAQNILHPGLSAVYGELLTATDGNEFYIRDATPFVGQTLGEASARCARALVCGLLRHDGEHWQPLLNLPGDTPIAAEDRLVMLARSDEEARALVPDRAVSEPLKRIALKAARRDRQPPSRKRLLLLGWNRRNPVLVNELASYAGWSFEIDWVSTVPAEERENAIATYAPATAGVGCRHIEGDYTLHGELSRLSPQNYDAIVIVSSDRLDSGEEADARAMMGFLLLEELLAGAPHRPQVLLELSDPDNKSLLASNRSETLVSPLVMSHMLSQVALRRELIEVFDELLTAGGAEVMFRDAASLGLSRKFTFAELEIVMGRRGETALGVFNSGEGHGERRLALNPGRDAQFELAAGDQVVVLTTT